MIERIITAFLSTPRWIPAWVGCCAAGLAFGLLLALVDLLSMKKGQMKIIFFPNGNTAAFKDGKQVSELQESWFRLYVSMLYALEIDATEIEFIMPDTKHAIVEETADGGFCWSIR